MACRGCAAKLAAAPLEGALARLETMASAAPPTPGPSSKGDGADRGGGRAAAPVPTDAAVVDTAADGSLLLQSVDGFPALVSDPWLNARLTTLHACGDLWASGAAVVSVQALVTLPEGAPALQEELLLQTLAGVRSVLDPLGARLIGGHTLEGRDGAGLALALTVNGRALQRRHWPKGPLSPGDALLLCGPLGSGVLFAAAAGGEARPGWIDAALERMQRSQAPLVDLLAAHGCHACTDITGFGLLGHLGEMLGSGSSPSPPLSVRLNAGRIAAFDGALALLQQGWASSLAPANARALTLLNGPVHLVGASRAVELAEAPEPHGTQRAPLATDAACLPALEALLIDPQTCGPLLAALPADRAEGALAALHRAGFAEASLIGCVRETPLHPARG